MLQSLLLFSAVLAIGCSSSCLVKAAAFLPQNHHQQRIAGSTGQRRRSDCSCNGNTLGSPPYVTVQEALQEMVSLRRQMSSQDWSDFQGFDDDDDDLFRDSSSSTATTASSSSIDTREYAQEQDTQEEKAAVGSTIAPPEIVDGSQNYEPLFVPQGTQLDLTEEHVMRVLQACREEIGTLFGYSAENRGVGITGGVDFCDMDGPSVIIRLKGRFWHERMTVLQRVEAYLMGRIPELISVEIEDEWQLTNEANEIM